MQGVVEVVDLSAADDDVRNCNREARAFVTAVAGAPAPPPPTGSSDVLGTSLPPAGTGPFGVNGAGPQVWLIAGLIGAGIAWLSTGAAGAGLVFIGGGSSRAAKRTRDESAAGPFEPRSEVVTPSETDYQPQMRPTGSRGLSTARKQLSEATVDVPGFRSRRD